MKRVLLRAPLLSVSGYGEHSRLILKTLLKYNEYFDVFVDVINWGQTSWISAECEIKSTIDILVQKTHQAVVEMNEQLHLDMTIQCTIPNEFQKITQNDVGVSALCETSKIPPQWIERINQMDHLIVPSKFNVEVALGTSCEARNNQTNEVVPNYSITETEVTPIGFSYRYHEPNENILNEKFKCDFNFLVVAQFGIRKNLENTISWFVEEFYDKQVGLVLKINVAGNSEIDREQTLARVEEILKKYPERECSIEVIHGYMTDEELSGLYNHPQIKGLISISHGESWCLPLFEAACSGLPVITTTWGGQVDYLYMENKKGKTVPMFTKVDYEIKPIQKEAVWPGVLEKDSQWAYPDSGNFKMKLRSFVRDHAELKKRADRLKNHLEVEYAEEKIMEKYHDILCADTKEMVDWLNELGSLEEV